VESSSTQESMGNPTGSTTFVIFRSTMTKLLSCWRGGQKFGTPLKASMFFASPKMKGRQPCWMSRIMQHHIKPVAEDLGIPLKGWHSLRHSYTLLRENGNNPKVVQDLRSMRRTTSPRTFMMLRCPRRSGKRTAECCDL